MQGFKLLSLILVGWRNTLKLCLLLLYSISLPLINYKSRKIGIDPWLNSIVALLIPLKSLLHLLLLALKVLLSFFKKMVNLNQDILCEKLWLIILNLSYLCLKLS